MPALAQIGLGSNLGDRKAILDAALTDLAAAPGVAVRAVSPYHETAPVGGPSGQGAFLNAAASLETTLDPEPLLDLLNEIEARAGRVRTVRWGERTLDLDLLLYDDRVLDTPRLTLPHPRLAFRRFVLAPLAEVAPEAVDPITGRTVRDLLANLDRRPSYVAVVNFPAFLSGDERPSAWDPDFRPLHRRLAEALPGVLLEDRASLVSPSRPSPPRRDRDFEYAFTRGSPWPTLRGRLQAVVDAYSSLTPAEAKGWIVSNSCYALWVLELDAPPWATPDESRAIRSLIQSLPTPTFAAMSTHHASLFNHARIVATRSTPTLLVDDLDSDATFQAVLAACAAARGG